MANTANARRKIAFGFGFCVYLSERNQVVNTAKITCIHAMKERNAGNYTSLHRFLFFGHMTLRSEIFAKGRFVRFKAIG